jgi:hypothetical protein
MGREDQETLAWGKVDLHGGPSTLRQSFGDENALRQLLPYQTEFQHDISLVHAKDMVNA